MKALIDVRYNRKGSSRQAPNRRCALSERVEFKPHNGRSNAGDQHNCD